MNKERLFRFVGNLEVDGFPWKENLFGQSTLSMNAIYIILPKDKFME